MRSEAALFRPYIVLDVLVVGRDFIRSITALLTTLAISSGLPAIPLEIGSDAGRDS